jgi:glycosyltransferase involved in cell wall biosynthesis
LRPVAAVISPDPSSAAGGVERTCQLLRPILERQGFDAAIVGPSREATRWEMRLGAAPAVLSRSAAAAAMAQKPDLVVSNGYLGWGCPKTVRRIHVFHGTMVSDTNASAGFIPTRERVRRIVGAGAVEALCGRGAINVSVSDSAAQELRRFYRVNVDEVIPNGIDTDTFAPGDRGAARGSLGLDPDRRYALFVGRFEPRKGSDLVVAAARSAGYELLIAGPDAPAGAQSLGILGAARLAEAYRAADCLLFPTRYEACSLVILEALASGIPVLTTPVGWMPTLLASVPEYRELCIEPAVASIVARLRALPEIARTELLVRAREFVAAENSLARWGQRWQALLLRSGFSGYRASVPGR